MKLKSNNQSRRNLLKKSILAVTMVEGVPSWQNGLRLIHNKIKTLVMKDFQWDKKNKWGMAHSEYTIRGRVVDFKTYFQLLKEVSDRSTKYRCIWNIRWEGNNK